MPLGRVLSVGLHHPMFLCLSTRHTGLAIRKRLCCIKWSPKNWKRSSPANRSATAQFRHSSNGNSVLFWAAVSWRGASCDGVRSSQCGAVTFVQRYGDALNANVHFHCLLIDG